MKSFWTKSALGAAAALLFVGAAQAGVIDFENVDTSGLAFGAAGWVFDSEVMTQNGYSIQLQDSHNPTLQPGNGPYIGDPGVGVGQLSNGANLESCPYGTGCPRGNTTTFLNVYNDAIAHIGATDNSAITLTSLQAAYVAMTGNASGSTVYLAIEADRADGTYAAAYYPLLSNTAFSTITSSTVGYTLNVDERGSTGSIFSGAFTDLFMYGYYCDAAKQSCSAFSTDQGNFALDNVTLAAAVPEPSEWMLMAAGLGAMGAFVRRRKNAAAAA